MKNKIVLGIAFVFMLLITISGALAALSDDQFTYWTFDDSDTSGGVSVDIAKGKNLTITSATTGIVGIIGEAYSFDGSSDSLTRSDSSLSFGDDFTIQFWMNFTTGAVNDVILSMDDAGDAPSPYRIQFDSCSTSTTCKLKIGIIDDGSTTHTVTNIGEVGGGNFQAGNWYHVIFAFNDTTDIMKTYVDGTLVNTSDLGSFTLDSAGTNFYVARYGGAGFLYEGVLDEMALWNRTLTDNDASNLYNSGQGNQYPYDLNKLTDIQITPNLPGTTDNIIANTTYTSQTNLNANITAKWLNGTTIIKQTTFNNTGNGTTLNYSINCVDFEACKLGNTLTISFNATNSQANSFKTKNVAIGLNLTVNVKDNSGTSVDTFTANVTNRDNTTETFQKSTTTNNVSFLLNAGNYSVDVSDATQGGTDYSTATGNITLDQATETINLTVFQSNTFDLRFFDEETNTIIDDRNITVEFLSDLEASNYTTENGTLLVSAFMPAEIEIRYNAPDYRERSYYHFLTNQSFTNLTLYLLNETTGSLVIVDVVDESGEQVESVVLQLLRSYIVDGNQEFRVVEMDKTDFSGEAIISAELNEPLYKLKVVRNVSDNEVLFSSASFEITNTLLSITANLLGNALEGFNSWNTITYTAPVYNTATKRWTATYTDNGGVINPGGQVCLTVDKTIGVDFVRVQKTCSSATSATLTVDYDDDNHGSIATLEADTNTENSVHILTYAQTLVGVREQIASNLGIGGGFLAAIFIYAFSSIMLFNPTTYIIGLIAGLFVSFSIGLINVTWGMTLTTFMIIGGIVALKTRT